MSAWYYSMSNYAFGNLDWRCNWYWYSLTLYVPLFLACSPFAQTVVTILHTNSFSQFTYIHLCEQSNAGPLSMQRSDRLSPPFALMQHSAWQFSLQACIRGLTTLTVLLDSGVAITSSDASAPCALVSLASTGSKHLFNTVEPPNRGHFGTAAFVLSSEVVLFSEVV